MSMKAAPSPPDTGLSIRELETQITELSLYAEEKLKSS
jgi:hypothetical protein